MWQLDADRAAVLEEVSALLSSLNQTIQDEAKDRKYRFHIKCLLKAHLRAGDSIDPDLDYITDDDDLAVYYFDGDKYDFAPLRLGFTCRLLQANQLCDNHACLLAGTSLQLATSRRWQRAGALSTRRGPSGRTLLHT